MAALSSLLQLSQQVQGRLSEIQSQLAQQTGTGQAVAGVVKATAGGPGRSRGNVAEEEPRAMCRDPRRDAGVLCVVEEASEVAAIERSARFRGRYHVLGGRLSPLDGLGPEALHLDRLVARIGNGSGVREVVVATNPSLEGEGTAAYRQQVLRPTGGRLTRLAPGL